MIRIISFLFICALFSASALAQQSVPEMPDPIRNLADEGAQIRYMGRDHGFDAWLTVKNGQEQYFYVPPGGSGFVMGLLFDNKGHVVTIDQVQRLRKDGDSLLDSLAGMETLATPTGEEEDRFAFQSPAERLFHDTENANWITLGYPSAPVIYAIIDPQCPHCHALITNLNEGGYLDRGELQLRLIPVGFSQVSKAQAAFLMAAPDPQERFLRHLAGDEDALPVREEINTQGVERNMAYMQGWKFDVTPMLIYRSKAGEVKIIRGQPRDIPSVLADLPPAR